MLALTRKKANRGRQDSRYGPKPHSRHDQPPVIVPPESVVLVIGWENLLLATLQNVSNLATGTVTGVKSVAGEVTERLMVPLSKFATRCFNESF